MAPASKYPEMLRVRVGWKHNLDQKEGCEQDIAVKKVFLHPKWDIRTQNTSNGVKTLTTHDIALIELSSPVNLTSNVKSMCLDNGQFFKAAHINETFSWYESNIDSDV
ncbi:Chymotrypsin-like elastase member 1 [Desmophyllum pertusum]|uniref:Chymotrypsin-like elastase member 1 n=1 Tax=Desmophyllum pertusum TaxID=174260 RepID=A0A9X0CL96_9CNID|nr:Chymotrypsin-like elastase member 1 [Desmophyllum pertusum]